MVLYRSFWTDIRSLAVDATKQALLHCVQTTRLVMGKLLRNAGLLLASIAFYAYQPTKQRFVTLGITRPVGSIQNVHGSELRIIEDTKHCEDLHLWPGNGLLYTACEGQHSPRMRWFPPMTVFDQVPTGEGDATGSLYVLDPKVRTGPLIVTNINRSLSTLRTR